jgi:hypothetical protein
MAAQGHLVRQGRQRDQSGHGRQQTAGWAKGHSVENPLGAFPGLVNPANVWPLKPFHAWGHFDDIHGHRPARATFCMPMVDQE